MKRTHSQVFVVHSVSPPLQVRPQIVHLNLATHIRSVQFRKPYDLIGWCMSGSFAGKGSKSYYFVVLITIIMSNKLQTNSASEGISEADQIFSGMHSCALLSVDLQGISIFTTCACFEYRGTLLSARIYETSALKYSTQHCKNLEINFQGYLAGY